MSAVAIEFFVDRMTEHDLVEVVEIEESSGLSRWGWDAYHSELQSSNRDLMLVARLKHVISSDLQIAGYIAARETAGELHINNVAVREEFRRKGVGSELLRRVIKKGRELGARNAFLEVRSGNASAQALYKDCGFAAIATRRDYYSDPREDALVMSRALG